MFLVQEHVRSSKTSHGARRNSKYRWFELSVFRFHRIILVCPKSIGLLQSERAQVSEFFDGLDFMIVLRHVRGLPLRLWHRHRIVAGRWCRQHGLVRIFFFVVGLEWPGFIVVVVVIGVGWVRSSSSLFLRGIRLPGLVDPVVGGSFIVVAGGIRLSGIRSPRRFVPGWPRCPGVRPRCPRTVDPSGC